MTNRLILFLLALFVTALLTAPAVNASLAVPNAARTLKQAKVKRGDKPFARDNAPKPSAYVSHTMQTNVSGSPSNPQSLVMES